MRLTSISIADAEVIFVLDPEDGGGPICASLETLREILVGDKGVLPEPMASFAAIEIDVLWINLNLGRADLVDQLMSRVIQTGQGPDRKLV